MKLLTIIALLFSADPVRVMAQEPAYVIFTIMGGEGQSPSEDSNVHTNPDDGIVRTAVADLRAEFGSQRPGKKRYIGFSMALVPTLNLKPELLKAQVNLALDAAERNGIPVFFHLDDEHFWYRSPELFRDPGMVEWSDFPKAGEAHGPVVPRYWLGWGDPISVFQAPPPCFECPAFRAAMGKRLKDCVAEPIVERLESWRKQGKGYLFAGVAAGNETGIPDYRGFADKPGGVEGMDMTQRPPVKVRMRKEEMVRAGYHSLHVRGYDQRSIERLARGKGRDVDGVMEELLYKVAGDYSAFQARTLNRAGISRERIYTHFTSPFRPFLEKMVGDRPASLGTAGSTNLPPPVKYAVNRYSRPGFTVSREMVDLKDLTAQLRRAHAAEGETAWAVVESYASTGQPGVPQTQQQYEEYLGGLLAHGARVVNVYGWNIPVEEKSPFAVRGSGVIPAVKRWLSGAKLPKGFTGYRPGRGAQPPGADAIQAKIRKLQEEAQAWGRKGRDPGPVVEQCMREFEPLIKAGKTAEAGVVLDRALLKLAQ